MPVSIGFTVPAGVVLANLTNYPCYLDLSTLDGTFWSNVASDGGDIRVYQGATSLPRHLIEIDTGAQTGHLWFKVPSLLTASDNSFILEVSNGLSTPAVGDADGQYAVWTDYECVYFLNGNFNDAKGDHALPTNAVGTTPTYIDFESGGGINCTTDFAQYLLNGVANSVTYTLAVTVTCSDFSGSANRQAFTFGPNYGTGARTCLGFHNTTGDPFTFYDDGNSWCDDAGGNTLNQRYRLVGTHNNVTDKRFYRDGTQVAIDTSVGAIGLSQDSIIIGSGGSTGTAWRGKIGFAYLRNSVLSAEWIRVEALMLSDQGAFYSEPTPLVEVAMAQPAVVFRPTLVNTATMVQPAVVFRPFIHDEIAMAQPSVVFRPNRESEIAMMFVAAIMRPGGPVVPTRGRRMSLM